MLKFFTGTKSIIPSLILISIVLFSNYGCKKDNDDNYTADFSFQFLDENNVQYQNESEGEYYAMIWDFGNGVRDTTTDKKQSYKIYYPDAGNYEVSLKLTNYVGGSKSVSKTVNIANTDFEISFTAEIDPGSPNYVMLKNTSLGSWDSFKWTYRGLEVENEMEHLAYFPIAGDYDIELIITKENQDFSEKQTVTITQDDPNYNPDLLWADEFDYTGAPDPSKWNIETGGGGWGNNELQYYTEREENVVVGNGVLTITALEESYGGLDYTSARITTQDKFDVKYGRIEARIRLPYSKGLWPAFWMLGANFSSVGWPACGEIDIMEMVGGDGNDNTCYATLHWDNDGEHAEYGESYTLPSGIFADNYHVFAVEWNDQEIKGFMDDIQYFTIDITPEQLSEFHNNFFIILNVAVGGNWPGDPDATTVFPQTMEVDWVRVYEL
jgi:beta-glucanase (GH16 family)